LADKEIRAMGVPGLDVRWFSCKTKNLGRGRAGIKIIPAESISYERFAAVLKRKKLWSRWRGHVDGAVV
jgi:hypothetical protein